MWRRTGDYYYCVIGESEKTRRNLAGGAAQAGVRYGDGRVATCSCSQVQIVRGWDENFCSGRPIRLAWRSVAYGTVTAYFSLPFI